MIVRSFCRFNPDTNYTPEQAAELARRINAGEIGIPRTDGTPYYRFMGWRFDIGRRPFLIEYAHGGFSRKYARSIGELRAALYLSRKDKVIADPFSR